MEQCTSFWISGFAAVWILNSYSEIASNSVDLIVIISTYYTLFRLLHLLEEQKKCEETVSSFWESRKKQHVEYWGFFYSSRQ